MDTLATSMPRWDLGRIYTGPADPRLHGDLEHTRAEALRFREIYLGRVARLSPAELRDGIAEAERLTDKLTMLKTYAALAFWADTRVEAHKALNDKVRVETGAIENELKFFEVELKGLPAAIRQAFLAEAEIGPYRYYLERMEKVAPYALSEEEERVLAIKDMTGPRAWEQLYTELTAGMQVPVALPDGERVVTFSEAKAMRQDGDRRVREAATLGLLQRFEQLAPVLVPIYNALYEDHRQTCKLRGYADPMAPTLLAEDLDREVVDALMSAVESSYPLAHRYYRTKARLLGLEDFSSHDLYAPLPAGDRKVPFDEARQIVLEAYGSFSPRFAEIAQRFFTDGFIDVPPAPGKQGGAFCARMVPGEHPYVLLNYTQQLGDVSTLAHELGHGVHFLLAGERQTAFNYYPIPPLAETASTFAELVTVNRLLALETDPEVRRQLMASRIEYAIFIIMLQVLNTRWELRAHALRAEGQVSPEAFCAIWEEETRRLYGDAVRMNAWEKWRWMTVPHLVQFRFYCYSYAFAQLLVYALYQHYQEQGEAFLPAFYEVLAAGGSAPAGEILAKVGVDIKDPAFWQKGLALLEAMLTEFEASVEA